MTEQEDFWAGDFGNDYSKRNHEAEYSVAKMALFARVLASAPGIKSVLEFGCNTGGNLVAIETMLPSAKVNGVEINLRASIKASGRVNGMVFNSSLHDFEGDCADLVFTSGVLIHTPPDELQAVYQKMVDHSTRYVMVCEYYSPRPEAIPYRGHTDRLWKRDFAGEMMDGYGLRLVDYAFVYHRDVFPQDDMTWFLMEKTI